MNSIFILTTNKNFKTQVILDSFYTCYAKISKINNKHAQKIHAKKSYQKRTPHNLHKTGIFNRSFLNSVIEAICMFLIRTYSRENVPSIKCARSFGTYVREHRRMRKSCFYVFKVKSGEIRKDVELSQIGDTIRS